MGPAGERPSAPRRESAGAGPGDLQVRQRLLEAAHGGQDLGEHVVGPHGAVAVEGEQGVGSDADAAFDARMYADGRCIVLFRGMSLRLRHVTRAALERRWRTAPRATETASPPSGATVGSLTEGRDT